MRILRGVAALAALAALVLGIPVALTVFGGNPFPHSLSGQAIVNALLRPASDRVLIGLITILGWVVWAALVASIVAEVLNSLPGRRRHQRQLRIPGFAVGQKLAAVLIVAVVSMIAVPHTQPVAHADPTQPTPAATTTATPAATGTSASPLVFDADTTAQDPAPAKHDSARHESVRQEARKKPQQQVHVVKRGEWLWNLAEHYLGDGSRWKEIAAANPGIDPDRLAVGQRLIIPVPPSTGSDQAASRTMPHEGDTVTVQRGDSLSSISTDLYGTSKHWPDLYEENRDSIDDPDLIDVGQKLELPDRKISTDTDHAIHHAHAPSGRDDQPGSGPTEEDQATTPTQQRSDAHDTTNTDADTGSGRRGSGADTTTQQAPATPPPTTAPSTTGQQPVQPNQTLPAADSGSSVTSLAAQVSVGLLLAAGLITALNTRRRRQLHARRPGRRIPQPSPAAADLEREIKAQHQPLQFEHLDTITRGIAAHCRHHDADLPHLVAVRVADTRIDLMLADASTVDPPAGVEAAADGSVWTVHSSALADIAAIAGIDDQAPPYPALVSLGRDADTAHVLIDLESAAALTVIAEDPAIATGAIAAIALELALSPWATDLDLTFVGPLAPGLAEALDHPAVTHVDDIDRVLTGLEQRAILQRDNLNGDTIGQKRLDPEIADAWSPRVVLFGEQLTADQADRLRHVITELPRVAIAAVTTHQALTPWSLTLTDDSAALAPLGLQLTPQLVSTDQYEKLLDLIGTSGTEETTPAPWWDHDADSETAVDGATVTEISTQRDHPTPQPADDDLPNLDQAADDTDGPTPHRRPLNLHALINADSINLRRPRTSDGDDLPLDDQDGWRQLISSRPVDHPMLRILGAPDLIGTATAPARYKQRVNEVLLYLLEHPGCTMPRLMDNLHIGRDYAKNVLGTLRKTLGADPDGNPYFPEMSRQRGYRLHEAVTCDYHYATRLIGRGVNTASSEALIRILSMVRGTPLFGAEDWAGVAELRSDIPSKIADVAHELTTRALAEGNIELARWAAEKGRLANPDEETLLADQLRTEQQAGNRRDVVKLVAHISDHAREHGRDLSDNTKEVLRRAVAM